MTKQEIFKGLQRAADDADYYDAIDALASAVENANDTLGSDQHPDFWNIALDSIQFTSSFEKKGVQKFLAFHGFEF